jgi:nucleotide-binding universal stress UspA family protein
MYTRMLVPLDGSKLAERALGVALPLAERHGATLILATVHEPVLPQTVTTGTPSYDTALDLEQRETMRRYLERTAGRLRKRAASRIETAFREGRVVPTLGQLTRDLHAQLVVLSTHGRGGFQRLWLGSVADGLVRAAPVPVLLLRGGRGQTARLGPTAVFRRIVVALDGSARAEAAIGAAEMLLGRDPGLVTLVHVLHPMTMAVAMQSVRRPDAEFTAAYLEPLAARVRAPGREVTIETRVDANVTRAIQEVVSAVGADVVALTPQGLRGAERFLMGSVADKLIRTATVPVLVVPGEEASTWGEAGG